MISAIGSPLLSGSPEPNQMHDSIDSIIEPHSATTSSIRGNNPHCFYPRGVEGWRDVTLSEQFRTMRNILIFLFPLQHPSKPFSFGTMNTEDRNTAEHEDCHVYESSFQDCKFTIRAAAQSWRRSISIRSSALCRTREMSPPSPDLSVS